MKFVQLILFAVFIVLRSGYTKANKNNTGAWLISGSYFFEVKHNLYFQVLNNKYLHRIW